MLTYQLSTTTDRNSAPRQSFSVIHTFKWPRILYQIYLHTKLLLLEKWSLSNNLQINVCMHNAQNWRRTLNISPFFKMQWSCDLWPSHLRLSLGWCYTA